MSSKENRMLFLFLLVVINVFGLIAGIYIGMSQILVNSRYGFITIIFAVTGIADYFLMKYRDTRIAESVSKQLATAEADVKKYKDRMLEIAEERDRIAAQLEPYVKGAVKEEYEKLKQKCDTIEAFRNSFPYKIAEGYVLYNVMRTDLQVGHASTWQIVGDYNGELWEVSIVRPLSQTYKEMINVPHSNADSVTEYNSLSCSFIASTSDDPLHIKQFTKAVYAFDTTFTAYGGTFSYNPASVTVTP